MRHLDIIYDPGCGFCARVRDLLLATPTYLGMAFLPYGGDLASRRYPGLCADAVPELLVIDDAGGIYEEMGAYLMCLYATVPYRPLALRLASPLLKPLARAAFAALGRNRHALSRLLGWSSDADLAHHLQGVAEPTCARRLGDTEATARMS